MNKIKVEELSFLTVSETEVKNFKETLNGFSEEHNLLEELLKLYKTFISSCNKNLKDTDVPTLQMYFICFREFLVSSQLVGQGHFSEAYSIISRASEAVGYGVVMKQDANKGKVWIENSGKKDFKKLFGEPFPKGNKLLHPTVFHIYNLTRDYGGHANFASTIHFVSITGKLSYEFVYCDYNDTSWIKRNLLMSLHSFTEFLIVFKQLFSKNLELNWIDELNKYVDKWILYRDANRALFNR